MSCATCGHTNPERTKFCGECGSSAGAAAAQVTLFGEMGARGHAQRLV